MEKAFITLYGAPDIPTVTYSSEDPALAGNVHAQLLAVIPLARARLDELEVRALAAVADSGPAPAETPQAEVRGPP